MIIKAIYIHTHKSVFVMKTVNSVAFKWERLGLQALSWIVLFLASTVI